MRRRECSRPGTRSSRSISRASTGTGATSHACSPVCHYALAWCTGGRRQPTATAGAAPPVSPAAARPSGPSALEVVRTTPAQGFATPDLLPIEPISGPGKPGPIAGAPGLGAPGRGPAGPAARPVPAAVPGASKPLGPPPAGAPGIRPPAVGAQPPRVGAAPAAAGPAAYHARRAALGFPAHQADRGRLAKLALLAGLAPARRPSVGELRRAASRELCPG